MGFDKVLNSQVQVQDQLSPAEAFAAIALAAIASDGYLSEEEGRAISYTLSRMKLFRSYSHDAMLKIFDKVLGIVRTQGINALFNAAEEFLPHDLREAAFAVAADLLLADGIVTAEERGFLGDLHLSLGITSDTATQIVQVMLIKNQG
ncbi:MAG: tellurite resistance TerB family protein [Nostocaceae cyanobacterium]|nr:tellurite resistance TerB family protein [Nostocaceae cyanobacterium]